MVPVYSRSSVFVLSISVFQIKVHIRSVEQLVILSGDHFSFDQKGCFLVSFLLLC